MTLILKGFSEFWYQNFQKIRFYQQKRQKKKFFDWLREPQLVVNLIIPIFYHFFAKFWPFLNPLTLGDLIFFYIYIYFLRLNDFLKILVPKI